MTSIGRRIVFAWFAIVASTAWRILWVPETRSRLQIHGFAASAEFLHPTLISAADAVARVAWHLGPQACAYLWSDLSRLRTVVLCRISRYGRLRAQPVGAGLCRLAIAGDDHLGEELLRDIERLERHLTGVAVRQLLVRQDVPVGFVNSAVADLQGNRAGAREVRLADRVAAVMLATAGPDLVPMVSSGRRDPPNAWGTKTLSCVSGSQFVLVDETSEQISSVHPHG